MEGLNSIDRPVASLTQSTVARLDRIAEEGLDRSEFAAQEMERIFATMLVKEMRSGLSGGIFGEGAGNDSYSAWFDEHLGRNLADAGTLNLAGQIKASIGATRGGAS